MEDRKQQYLRSQGCCKAQLLGASGTLTPCEGRRLPLALQPELVLPHSSCGPAPVLCTRVLGGGRAELWASGHKASPEPHRSILLPGLGANRAGRTCTWLSEGVGRQRHDCSKAECRGMPVCVNA